MKRGRYRSISGVLPDSAVRILSEWHWLRAINVNTVGCVGEAPRPVSRKLASALHGRHIVSR
jgi:hypothetical protein